MIYGKNLDYSMFFWLKKMFYIILCSVVILTSDFSIIIIFPHTYPMQELEILRTYIFPHNYPTQELKILRPYYFYS